MTNKNKCSNINQVIKAVLNFLFFFLRKDFARTKSTKSTKSTKTPKALKGTKTLRQKHKTQISEQGTISPLDVF